MEKIKPVLTSGFFILLVLLFILSCFNPYIQKNQTRGVYHRVKKNETVRMIARAYHVRLQDLVVTNNITDLDSVKEGSIIFIPNVNQVIDDTATNAKTSRTAENVKARKDISSSDKSLAKKNAGKKRKTAMEAPSVADEKKSLANVKSLKTQSPKISLHESLPPIEDIMTQTLSDEKSKSSSETKKPADKIKINKKMFIWPVHGSVAGNFGIQPNKTYNNWIKIVCPARTKVKAAASGTVIFSSQLKNYGETVIIRHKDNLATVYTHLKKRYVKTDQNVKKGEMIATVGETDDNGNTYINFEIRLEGKARNPILFLP